MQTLAGFDSDSESDNLNLNSPSQAHHVSEGYLGHGSPGSGSESGGSESVDDRRGATDHTSKEKSDAHTTRIS